MPHRTLAKSPHHQSPALEELKRTVFAWIDKHGQVIEREITPKIWQKKPRGVSLWRSLRYKRRRHPSQCNEIARLAGVTAPVIARLLDGMPIRFAQAEKIAKAVSKRLVLVDL